MSKQIRLEIPMYHKGNFLSSLWLKVVGNETLAFIDSKCTIPVQTNEPNDIIYLCIPDEMNTIQIFRLLDISPCDYISLSWQKLDTIISNYRFSSLKKLFIVFDDQQHEITVENGKPSRTDWIYYTSVTNSRALLFLKKWVFIISVLKNSTLGTLYLSSDLTE